MLFKWNYLNDSKKRSTTTTQKNENNLKDEHFYYSPLWRFSFHRRRRKLKWSSNTYITDDYVQFKGKTAAQQQNNRKRIQYSQSSFAATSMQGKWATTTISTKTPRPISCWPTSLPLHYLLPCCQPRWGIPSIIYFPILEKIYCEFFQWKFSSRKFKLKFYSFALATVLFSLPVYDGLRLFWCLPVEQPEPSATLSYIYRGQDNYKQCALIVWKYPKTKRFSCRSIIAQIAFRKIEM